MEDSDEDSNSRMGDKCMFEVSTEPSRNNDIVPRYELRGMYKITGEDLEAEGTKAQARRPGGECWNCGLSGHSIRDCTKSIDRIAIQRNKQSFVNNRNMKKAFLRYHIDKEQKYGHFQPGKLSKRMRKALGLRHDELPKHIYRMRMLGYPPGWLEEAKIIHSGISMFDSKGNVVGEPGDEEGEVVDFEQRSKYDINRLVEYPGFNVDPPPGTRDDWERNDAAPMLEKQSLEYMVEFLMPNAAKAYKRRKLVDVPSVSPPTEREVNAKDMEWEETPETTLLPDAPGSCKFTPPLPDEDEDRPPPPPEEDSSSSSFSLLPAAKDTDNKHAIEDGEVGNNSCGLPVPESGENTNQSSANSFGRNDSPTLGDLEERKQSLLAQLSQDTTTSSADSTQKEVAAVSSSSTTPRPRADKNQTPTSASPSTVGQTKTVDLGTPVLKSFSPFTQLPSQESFSQNICDVINFENLPDSTGVYDRLVGIIGKVRETVARINSEN